MSSLNNLLSASERTTRTIEKQNLLLSFLGQHIWSSQEILQLLLGLESRQATHKTLVKFEREGLIKRHSFITLYGKLTLWGITQHGQGFAFNVVKGDFSPQVFEPSKISEQRVPHHFALQKLHLIAEKNGWYDWMDGNRLGEVKFSQRPDAIAFSVKHLKVAVEFERSFKTRKRYEQILFNYLKLIRNEEISKVVWVTPTREFSLRLETIIKSIRCFNFAGNKIQVDPIRHHANIHFLAIDDWANFCRSH